VRGKEEAASSRVGVGQRREDSAAAAPGVAQMQRVRASEDEEEPTAPSWTNRVGRLER